MNVYLDRAYLPNGTFGVLRAGGNKLVTVERPWEDNKPGISAIPEGVYKLDPYESPKFGPCWIIHGGTVSRFESADKPRFGILIHPIPLPS